MVGFHADLIAINPAPQAPSPGRPPVDALVVGGGVPGGVHHDDPVRGGQRQAQAAHLAGQQEHRDVGARLELAHELLRTTGDR